MRIIAGSARGRKILSVPMKMRSVRPISGRIRQSLFDILKPKITASRFLDLFAGTGAVGLEALSRGAESVVFVERDPKCVAVIEKNLVRVGWDKKAKALRGDATSPLSWLSYRSGVSEFDLIFMGPPYVDAEKRPLALSTGVLAHIAQAKILEKRGWVIVQHHQKEVPVAPPGLEQFRQSKYGDTRVSFFRIPAAPAASAAPIEPQPG
ncbi:MAG TPA: 16S rRNA (guanine(966)-N(2))-methyltransferase RsmD [Elusimicrobiota bacterium]|nr:16S rRNA (guanine(966)-N(2))-methyltransferase RsmD [Elusimicrobiota bacterium]